jgi:6-phosphogluconolactonase (cycloisomerase 2 family)
MKQNVPLLGLLLVVGACNYLSTERGQTSVLYASHSNDSDLHAFFIDNISGALRWTNGSPYPRRGRIDSAAVHPVSKRLFLLIGSKIQAVSIGETGELVTELEVQLPSWEGNIAMHPNGRYLYKATPRTSNMRPYITIIDLSQEAVGKDQMRHVETERDTGFVAFDTTGELFFSLGGSKPEYNATMSTFKVDGETGDLSRSGPPEKLPPGAKKICVHPENKALYALTRHPYSGDSCITVFEHLALSGTLLPANRPIQLSGRVSDMTLTPDGRYLYATVRGDNRVVGFRTDENGLLQTLGTWWRTGDSPSSLALTPDGQFMYVTNENSQDISGFRIRDDGSLVPLADSPLPIGARVESAFVATQ